MCVITWQSAVIKAASTVCKLIAADTFWEQSEPNDQWVFRCVVAGDERSFLSPLLVSLQRWHQCHLLCWSGVVKISLLLGPFISENVLFLAGFLVVIYKVKVLTNAQTDADYRIICRKRFRLWNFKCISFKMTWFIYKLHHNRIKNMYMHIFTIRVDIKLKG